ncbi:MAG: S4 domain-containing protein [Candidatus Acidiferrales bacterium]
MQERIQKIIARAGLASRRHAEEMMTAGQVTLNGKVVTELGTKADASRDHIKVNGKLLPAVTAQPLYLAMNKPPEVVATMSDPEERKSLAGFLKTIPSRVFPIGRLEYSSTGLLLLTNDGELASGIMRAHNLRQTYMLKLKGFLTLAELSKIQITTGLRLTRAKQGDNAWYEVTMADARRDVLREKLQQLGHPVEKTRRIQVGPVEMGTLPTGAIRELLPREILGLQKAVSAAARQPRFITPKKQRQFVDARSTVALPAPPAARTVPLSYPPPPSDASPRPRAIPISNVGLRSRPGPHVAPGAATPFRNSPAGNAGGRGGAPGHVPGGEGPRHGGPPREGAFRGGAPRHVPGEDGHRHDSPPRGGSFRGGPPRNAGGYGRPERSGPPREGSFRSGPPRGAGGDRGSERGGAPRHSGPPRPGSFGHGPAGNAPGRSGTSRPSSFRGGPPRNGVHSKAPGEAGRPPYKNNRKRGPAPPDRRSGK